MSKFDEMMKRADFYALIQFMMYGIDDDMDFSVDYEERVENSFDRVFEILEKEFPNLNRDNPVLFGAISEFAIAHDEAYFKEGLIMGLKLYKSMEKIFQIEN